MSVSNDGSESVDQFLARIASVKEGRDEANAASRRLDEEFLKGRQERQARRLERARSISPSKTGPAKTSSLSSDLPTAERAINPPVEFSPSAASLSRSNAVTGRVSPTREQDLVPPRTEGNAQTSTSATGLARSGTLSWQQRPSSKDGSRQRPLSGFSTVRNLPRQSVEDDSQTEPSRSEIAAALSQKDPAWFRQTQERGVGSPAYRKSQVDEPSESLPSGNMQLPGMSRPREPSKSPVPEARNDKNFTREGTAESKDIDRFKRGTTPDIAALRNSIAEKPPSLRPNSQDPFENRPLSLENPVSDESTPSLARASSALSQNRPVSPSKGLGGFVESAMMKRSDSVSKRWNVKTNTGLKRGDSVAGGRPLSMHSRGLSRDIPMTRGDSPSSPLASSRPGSSHNLASGDSPGVQANRSSRVLPETSKDDKDTGETDYAVSEQPRQDTTQPQTTTEDSQVPTSPSKTMDPRRWSPTKSTWLESALQQKTEPPKLQPMKEELPKWKVDLQRSKSRAGRDASPEKRPQKPDTKALGQMESASLDTKPQPSPSAAAKSAFPGWSAAPAKVADKVPSTKEPSSQSPVASSKPNPTGSIATNQSNDAKSPAHKEQSESSPKPAKPATMQAPALKPKPQTPPKTDLRATLKSRAPEASQTASDEPEFKSMFGKLKRTTTQNYVAPDELKDNILSGKAALNTTGGPVKTKRVDEFKESLLAKKEAMKTSGSKPTTRVESRERDEEPLPEALARRKTLSKASAPDLTKLGSNPREISSKTEEKPPTMPKPNLFKKSDFSDKKDTPDSTKVITVREGATGPPKSPTVRAVAAQEEKTGYVKSTSSIKTVVDPMSPPATGPKPDRTTAAKPDEDRDLTSNVPVALPKTSAVSQPLATASVENIAKAGFPTNSKLASRLNPNLAAMLSRGGSPKPQSSPGASTEDLSRVQSASADKGNNNDDGSLTHMTKGRAKGPKRRAPKADAAATTKSTPVIEQQATSPDPQVSSSPKPIATTPKPAPTWRPKPSAPTKPTSPIQTPLRELAQPKMASKPPTFSPKDKEKEQVSQSTTDKTRPIVASKSPELRRVSSPPSTREKPITNSKPATPQKPSFSTSSKASPEIKSANNQEDGSKPQTSDRKSFTTPVKPDKVDVVAKKETKPVPQRPKPTNVQGLGLQMSPSPQAGKLTTKPRVLTPPPDADLKSSSSPRRLKDTLQEYVGPIAEENDKADFDAQHFLAAAKQPESKIKTSQHTVHEISGDGRKIALPPQQEHILYEDSMYLIVHKYSTQNSNAASEVQLWCGDRVPDAAVEDVQIFCRRDAREHNAKLEVVKQGKESANFIQGFGGILIVRRSKSSALYMLCGRRHLGQVVFDEVDMSKSNLCPGFAYLVSASYGRLFLWKGKGAGQDETSSAKLIGSDLSLTGEIEEVDQGSEPSAFWDAVENRTAENWSSDWHQRADMQGYPSVLYRVEHERPSMLTNLASWGLKRAASPVKQQTKATCERFQSFTQSDLEAPAIHILDAYRTLYIILTKQCISKAAEFVTSLYLAQEFAMLSPAIQDRPVLPTCYVVAGDVPADVRACFRKWSALEATSLVGQKSLCVRLEEVMEALSL